jgi:4-amino-4-deoxy-L-arabinose transferase-like glycosyltransferase
MIGRGRHSARVWWPWLGLWTAVGLGIRLASLFGPHRSARTPGGDAYYYHNAANLLVAGKGFINPFVYYSSAAHQQVQTATWPPLFVLVLAIPSLVGLKTFFAGRVWCCVIGAAGIVVGGYAGREIGGRRVGLIAALLVAVYPNLWMSDELGLSEALSPVLVALVLWAAYRFWKHPGLWPLVGLAASVGVASLARDELSLLMVFLVVPLVLMARTLRWWRRIGLLAVAGLTALLIIGPWVGYNMSRFDDPVFISSGFGVTLASANCAQLYQGPYEGYWSLECAVLAKDNAVNPRADESVQGAETQAYALHFIGTHRNRILPVEMARLGRAFAFFHPLQQIRLDSTVETRPYRWALVGLGMYYALLALSVGGVIILRRRRVPVFPLVVVGVDVAVSVALTFGQTRYRSTFEIALVLAAAVPLEWLWSRFGPRYRPERSDRSTDDDHREGGAGGSPAEGDTDHPIGSPGTGPVATPVPTG